MAAAPTITAILPTYRRPALLSRAIKSVLSQTYPALELRVYDNCSGDATGAVVAEAARDDARVHYWCHEQNIGAPANFRFGLDRVQTPFLSLLADDDVLLPDFYESAMAALTADPEAAFCALRVFQVDERGRVLDLQRQGLTPGRYLPPQGLLAMLEHGHPTWTGILFRTSLREQIGGLDPKAGLSADMDFELRIAARAPFLVSPQPGAIFLVHTAGASSAPRMENVWPCWDEILRHVEGADLGEGERAAARSWFDRRLREACYAIAIGNLAQGDPGQAEGAAALLGSRLHDRRGAALVRFAAALSRALPPVRRVAGLLIALRRWMVRRRLTGIQRLFDERYRRLLD